MSFKVQVGPPQIAIHQGQTVLVCALDGQIVWPSHMGLYFLDTRLVSAWAVYANGEPWELLNGGAVTYYAARIFLTNRGFLTEDGEVPARSLSFMLSRSISGGMHEDLDITNYGHRHVSFNLEIALRSDFADIFEVKLSKIVRRGRITTEWLDDEQELSTRYHNGDFHRAVTITTNIEAPRAVYANGRLSFGVTIDPGRTWHCCLLYGLADGGRRFAAPQECVAHAGESAPAESLAALGTHSIKDPDK